MQRPVGWRRAASRDSSCALLGGLEILAPCAREVYAWPIRERLLHIRSGSRESFRRARRRRPAQARYRLKLALEKHADPSKDPRNFATRKTTYEGPKLTGNRDADAVRLLFYQGPDKDSYDRPPDEGDDAFCDDVLQPRRRPGSAPAARGPALRRRSRATLVGGKLVFSEERSSL